LPLTQPTPSDSGGNPPTVRLNVEPKVKVEVVPIPFPDPLIVEVGDVKVPKPQVTIVMDEVQLLSMPPISKQWHRARVNKPGDAFWAIPSLDLDLRMESEPNPKPCTRSACRVDLKFRGPDFNVHEVVLAVDGMVVRAPDERVCRPVRPHHSYYLECAIYLKEAPDRSVEQKPDLCMQIRRSEVIERDGDENSALDIRWMPVNWNPNHQLPIAGGFGPGLDFADLGVPTHSDQYDKAEHGDRNHWFDSLCDFPRF
jgi:hypothetical protein